MYEFEKKGRWVEFDKKNWQECFGYQTLSPFYNDRAIVSTPASDRIVDEMKKTIELRIKGAIQTTRSYEYQFETQYFDKFDFINVVPKIETVEDYVKLRMEQERLHGMRDELLRKVDEARLLVQDVENRKRLKANLDKITKKLLNTVVKNLKPGLKYEERSFHFKHADANRISEKIKVGCKELLKMEEKNKPKFAVGVDVERLPGQICPVRILILLIHGTAES
jgi:hypothetical protein